MILTAFLSQFVVKGNGLLKTEHLKHLSQQLIFQHMTEFVSLAEWVCFSDCALRGSNMHGFPVSEAVGEFGQFVALG